MRVRPATLDDIPSIQAIYAHHVSTGLASFEDVPPDGLRVNYHLVIEIEGGKRPACVAEVIALHMR